MIYPMQSTPVYGLAIADLVNKTQKLMQNKKNLNPQGVMIINHISWAMEQCKSQDKAVF